MGVLNTVQNTIGKVGRKIYESSKTPPPFEGRTLKEKLCTIVIEKRLADRQRRQRQALTWYLMELYYRGYQSIMTTSNNTLEVFEDEDFYIENQFRRHVDTVVQSLNRAESDTVVRPASDSPKDIATARVADPILAMQLADVGYDAMKTRKNQFKCLFGNAFIFTDYITDARYGSIVTPKFSYEEQPDPTFDPEDPMNAGQPQPSILTKTVSGYSKRNKGRQVGTVCSPLEINCPADIQPFTELPYLQWISRQDSEIIEYLYPGLDAGEGGFSAVEVDLAQQYVDVLNNLPGNVLGDTVAYSRGSSTRRKSELVRSWLKPCTFRGDKELLREFPDGVHVTTVNGQVVDYYPEDLNDRWTHEVLIPIPHSLLGDGLYDAILVQDQINETDSLMIRHIRYSTVGHKVYDSNIIKPENVVNDPKNGWIPAAPSLDKTVNDSVKELPPTQLSGDVAGWIQNQKSVMQDMTSAYDPEAGKSTGANSPYSQSVFLAEKASGRWKGSNDFNRPELVRFHTQLLEDARSNWLDMRQRAVMDNSGQWSFQQFSQADLQGDVDIILSDSDFKPKSRAEQVQGLQMRVTLEPIYQSLSAKQKIRVDEMLGLPPDQNPMSVQIARAYRIIDWIKKGVQYTPLPMVDDAQAQIPVIMEFLAGEDGDALAESDPEARSNIYGYMVTLSTMAMQQMSSSAGAMAHQIAGKPMLGQPQPQGGSAPQEKPGQQPGGQLGQPGGGPNAGAQPAAQSPAPAPPVAPPSPGNP